MTLLWRSQVLILRTCVFVCALKGRRVNKNGEISHMIAWQRCVLVGAVCVCVFADNWKCNLLWGGYDPGPSSTPLTPPPYLPCVRQLCVAPLGALEKQSCPLCPYAFLFVCVWKIRPFCSSVYVCAPVLVLIPPFSYNEVELQLHYELFRYWLEVIWN